MGLYGKVSGSIVHSFSETLVRDENVNVIARTIIQNGQIGFPPDLHPTAMWLVLSDRFRTLMASMPFWTQTDRMRQERRLTSAT